MPPPPQNSPALLHARAQKNLDERTARGRRRELRVATPVRVNLADNDYLGLANDEEIKNAVRAALASGPVSASSSPLVRGYQEVHAKLEANLCAWHDFPSGLVWNSGYAANQSVIGMLAGPGDMIFADRLIHNSLVAGILKSGARFTRFEHNDLDELEKYLRDQPKAGSARWVVTESVYSMDGDSPDLTRLAEMKRRHGFIWMLDEAHALGWYGNQGQGCAATAGIAGEVDILVGTFGKALGGMGAYSLFHDPLLREALINQAGEFIYSTYLTPLMAVAAQAAIGRVRELAPQAETWRALSRQFREDLKARGWQTAAGDSAIVPVVIGGDARTLALHAHLLAQGFAVGAIRPPTVPEGTARLRISLKATTTGAELNALLEAMDAWRAAQPPTP